MKLNPDCIRDILFYIEENTDYETELVFDEYSCTHSEYDSPLIDNYGLNQFFYHLSYCRKADLIEIPKTYTDGTFTVSDLTPLGHEFVSNIRNEDNWKTVKKTANKIGSTSIGAFIEISAKVISELISKAIL